MDAKRETEILDTIGDILDADAAADIRYLLGALAEARERCNALEDAIKSAKAIADDFVGNAHAWPNDTFMARYIKKWNQWLIREFAALQNPTIKHSSTVQTKEDGDE